MGRNTNTNVAEQRSKGSIEWFSLYLSQKSIIIIAICAGTGEAVASEQVEAYRMDDLIRRTQDREHLSDEFVIGIQFDNRTWGRLIDGGYFENTGFLL